MERNVGFGSPGFYGMKELIELSLGCESIGIEHISKDEVNQLKKITLERT